MGSSYILNIGIASSIVAGFWYAFDQWLWKFDVFRKLGISELPDLNGVWVGEVDRLGEDNPHRFELKIFQTYTRISIQTNSGNSKGNSVSAIFLTDETRKKFDLVNYWSSRTKALAPGVSHQEEFKGLSLIDIRTSDGEVVLEDYYFTDRNPPTKGKVRLVRLPETEANTIVNSANMNALFDQTIDVLSSKSGAEYIGCLVEESDVQPYIEELSRRSKRKFASLVSNRENRDGDDHHITLISPQEYASLSRPKKTKLKREFGTSLKFETHGLGRAEAEGNEAYFVVLSSNEAIQLRRNLGLEPRDLHITIGFKDADVHGVGKGKDSLLD
jgi:hypothetical protein